MFFGTTTTLGLKASFTGTYPDSFHLGYKRKEFSFIPLGSTKNTQGEEIDVYPSVLAVIDTTPSVSANTAPSSNPPAGLLTGQFFATGVAADLLANDSLIRTAFEMEARDAFKAYRAAVSEQEAEASRILRCYVGVSLDKLPLIWENANVNGLLRAEDGGRSHLDAMKLLHNDAMRDPTAQNQKIREANRIYASDITIVEGASPVRVGGLEKHRKKVCEIATSS
jgi:hypothetical protein